MNIFSKIKGWFKKEENVSAVASNAPSFTPASPEQSLANSQAIENVINPAANIPHERRSIDKPCALCGNIIGQDKWIKKGGQHFHKKCWKTKSKEVAASGFNV